MPFSAYDIECIEKAKKMIDTDIRRHLSICSVAESVGMGATKLKTGFKQMYGLGLFAYLQQQRMDKAATLLTDTDKTIKEISKIAGFRYRSNFITAFTAYHGMPPGRYRKKHLDE
jgi:AraC-like DNA-binding protein